MSENSGNKRKVGRPRGPALVQVTVRIRPAVRELVTAESRRNGLPWRTALETLVERGSVTRP